MRAESLGVDVRGYTLLAFAIGSAYGGFAGALYAPLVEFIDPAPFALGPSLLFLLMVVIGGAGSLVGPFIGAGVAVLLPEWLRFAESYYLIVYAVLVMVMMAFCPSGIVGLVERLLTRKRRPHRRRQERGARGGRPMSTVLDVRDVAKSFGGVACRARRVVRGARGRDPRADRAQRLRQVDALQLHPGPAAADARRGAARRPDRHGLAALPPQPPGRQPHLPAAAGLPAADRAREPDPGGAGAQGLAARPACSARAMRASRPMPSA